MRRHAKSLAFRNSDVTAGVDLRHTKNWLETGEIWWIQG